MKTFIDLKCLKKTIMNVSLFNIVFVVTNCSESANTLIGKYTKNFTIMNDIKTFNIYLDKLVPAYEKAKKSKILLKFLRNIHVLVWISTDDTIDNIHSNLLNFCPSLNIVILGHYDCTIYSVDDYLGQDNIIIPFPLAHTPPAIENPCIINISKYNIVQNTINVLYKKEL